MLIKCFVFVAYDTNSFNSLTLALLSPCLCAVPYEQVDADAALVEMFGQVGAYKCKYVLAVGALAGLTVSMFGSMFPMPRIVYAMAQDGLIFRQVPYSLLAYCTNLHYFFLLLNFYIDSTF